MIRRLMIGSEFSLPRQVRYRALGFILPVVILLSVAITIVGTLALTVISRSDRTMSAQYHQTLADEAAQSGVKAALACFAAGTATWSVALSPNVDCDGTVTPAVPYLLQDGGMQSTFSVPAPITTDNVRMITSTGKVTVKNAVGAVYQTVDRTIKAEVRVTGGVGAVVASPISAAGGGHAFGTSVSNSTTYVITDAGEVYAWGHGRDGQLGHGTMGSGVSSATPVKVSGLLDGKKVVSVVVAGGGHGFNTLQSNATAYALTDAGEVYAWGHGRGGQLGHGAMGDGVSSATPVKVSGLLDGKKVIAVAAADSGHGFGTLLSNATAYAVTDAGEVYAWGHGRGGQLGHGAMGDGVSSATPVKVSGLLDGKKVVSVTASSSGHRFGTTLSNATAYAVTDAGEVYAWGHGRDGQLGNGLSGDDVASATPVKVGGLLDGKKVESVTVSGSGHGFNTSTSNATAYAVTDAGEVYAWGHGRGGQLGNGLMGDTVISATPVRVEGLLTGKKVLSVTASDSGHKFGTTLSNATAYAVTDAGEVYAWGHGRDGQLGNGLSGGDVASATPVKVGGLLDGKKVESVTVSGSGHGFNTSTSNATAYAVTDAGEVYAWGHGRDGQLGHGTMGSGVFSATPVKVSGLLDGKKVVAISAADSGHGFGTSLANSTAYAVTDTGEVYAWGHGRDGQLGHGTTNVSVASPVKVGGLLDGKKAAIPVMSEVVEVSAPRYF